MKSRLFKAIVMAGASMTGGCNTQTLSVGDAAPADAMVDERVCQGFCGPPPDIAPFGASDLGLIANLDMGTPPPQADLAPFGGPDAGLIGNLDIGMPPPDIATGDVARCFGVCVSGDFGVAPSDLGTPRDGNSGDR
jgi:hypothetical protein